MAELLRLRSALNLHSELLETPDIYWEEPKVCSFKKFAQ